MIATTTASSFSTFTHDSQASAENKNPRPLDASRLVHGLLIAAAVVGLIFVVGTGIEGLFQAISPLVSGACDLWAHPMGNGVL